MTRRVRGPELLALLPLLLIPTTNEAANCRSYLLEKCTCGRVVYDRELQYVVNCTDTGFINTAMLTELPDETQALIFTGNHIEEVPWNVFGELKNLTRLKTVDMSNNGIREIRGKSYHHVVNVERLILNHNQLSISDRGDENFHHPRIFSNFINLRELYLTNAFEDNTDDALANDLHDVFINGNLSKLFKLHLEQNEIKSFRDKYVFCNLSALTDLYLAENNIPGLNFNITCIEKLRFLDLQYNNITALSRYDLDTLDGMTYPRRSAELTIDIRGNPLRCDAASRDLYDWMMTTNVTIRNKDFVQCHRAKYGNKYIIDLKNYADGKHARVSRAVGILVVILSLILVSLLVAYAYLSKEKIKYKLSPLLDLVYKKVRYTTIESQDV